MNQQLLLCRVAGQIVGFPVAGVAYLHRLGDAPTPDSVDYLGHRIPCRRPVGCAEPTPSTMAVLDADLSCALVVDEALSISDLEILDAAQGRGVPAHITAWAQRPDGELVAVSAVADLP